MYIQRHDFIHLFEESRQVDGYTSYLDVVAYFPKQKF